MLGESNSQIYANRIHGDDFVFPCSDGKFNVFSLKVGFKGFHISKEKQDTKIPFLHCGQEYQLAHGSVVIAAVISCTNNCNPSVMLTAGKIPEEFPLIGSPSENISSCYHPESVHLSFHFVIDRSPGQEGCGGGACCQTLYPDQPGSWQWHGHSLPQHQWSPALL